jgi:hypothetical protein
MDKPFLKTLICCLFFFLTSSIYSQNVAQYSFSVHRYSDSVRVESCIPYNLYNSRVVIPNNTQQRIVMPSIPIHVTGSKWVNECLIINWLNLPNEEIIGYIKEFTILREDQIILSE